MKLDPKFSKFVVLLNASVPLALLCWDAYWHELGANPMRNALQTTGMLALIFLLLSLTITPARKISGWNFLSHFRRLLGLFAFFYGVIHLAIYFTFDLSLNFPGLIDDVVRRPFILLGMTALVLMVPLALTSTNRSIKRLGAARWKRLHQLVYISAIAGALHFYMQAKADVKLPVALSLALAVLLGYRVIEVLRTKMKMRVPAEIRDTR